MWSKREKYFEDDYEDDSETWLLGAVLGLAMGGIGLYGLVMEGIRKLIWPSQDSYYSYCEDIEHGRWAVIIGIVAILIGLAVLYWANLGRQVMKVENAKRKKKFMEEETARKERMKARDIAMEQYRTRQKALASGQTPLPSPEILQPEPAVMDVNPTGPERLSADESFPGSEDLI